MDMGPVDQVSLSFNFSRRGCLIKNFPFHLPYVCFFKKIKIFNKTSENTKNFTSKVFSEVSQFETNTTLKCH